MLVFLFSTKFPTDVVPGGWEEVKGDLRPPGVRRKHKSGAEYLDSAPHMYMRSHA